MGRRRFFQTVGPTRVRFTNETALHQEVPDLLPPWYSAAVSVSFLTIAAVDDPCAYPGVFELYETVCVGRHPVAGEQGLIW